MKNELIRYISALVIILTMLISMMAPVLAIESEYSDIPTNWARTPIIAAIKNGLLVGYNGKVSPNDPLTRAQMVTIINRAFGATVKADISNFTDVPATAWYRDDIAKAVNMGIMYGYNNQITPNDNITREQAFAIIARALKLSKDTYTSLDRFTDKDQIATYFRGELSALAEAGYIVGSNNALNPKGNITRAEFAQVMYNIVKSYIREPGTYTEASGNVMINVPDVTLKDVVIYGDLIIGDGVGTGDVTLDNVNVRGRMLVRGGGSSTVHIINGSSISGSVVIDNVNNQVRILTDEGITVQDIDAWSDVILEGVFGEITIVGEGSNTVEIKGEAKNLTIEAPNADVIISGKVETVTTAATATKANITVAKDAEVSTIVANGSDMNIGGEGKVNTVEAKANNVVVNVPGAQVTADPGVTGTVAGDVEVNPGGSATVPSTPTDPGTGAGPGTGGSKAVTINSLQLLGSNIDDINIIKSGDTYTIDLSALTTSQEENKKKIINGLKVNSSPSASKIVVVGYDDKGITSSNGEFSLGAITGIGFDGDVTVYTIKSMFAGAIAKDIRVYSGDRSKKITVVLKITDDDTEVNIPSEYLGYYTLGYESISATEKKITATLKSNYNAIEIIDFAPFYKEIIALASVPEGYSYDGIALKKGAGDYTDYYKAAGSLGAALSNLLEKPVNTITLGDISANDISANVRGSKAGEVYTVTVVFE